jgi:DNA topoisomerase-1
VELVSAAFDQADARQINTLPFESLEGVVLRNGRYGPYLERGGERVSVPEDIPPDELTPEKAQELLDSATSDRVIGADPETGREILGRTGRFGPYVQLAAEGDEKPRTASLFKSMSLESLTLEEALLLLSLPRSVGVGEDGEEITAQNGRYGPYLKKGSDSRSLETEDQIFTVTVSEALALFAQPKRRRGQSSAAPLRDLGVDPNTGWAIVLRDGRFGPYVTDGGVNASLRREDSVESMTIERALTLLAARRERLESEGKPVKPGKPPAGEPAAAL